MSSGMLPRKETSSDKLQHSKSIEDTKPLELSRKHKLIITSTIYYGYFAFGVGFSLISAAILDVAENVNSTFESATNGLVVRSVSYCIGSLIAGFAFKCINRVIGFASALVSLGIGIIGVPFFRTLTLYLLSESVTGSAAAALDVAPNTWILEIWQTRANPALQGMHFCYAVGQFIAPLVVAPFLSSGNVTTSSGNDTGTQGSSGNLTTATTPSSVTYTESRIVIPYSIAFVILISAAVSLMILYCSLTHMVPSNEIRQDDKRNQSLLMSEETKRYRMIVIILGCLLFLVYSGIEFNSFTFFVTFVVSIDKLGVTKATAAHMSALLSLFYAIGRLTSIYGATVMRTTTMLALHLSLVGLGNLLLWIFAPKASEVMIWISITIMGFGYSCMTPAFYAFLEDRIQVNSMICGFFMFFSTVSSIVISFTTGKFLRADPLSFVYTNMICLAFCYVVFALFYITDQHFKRSNIHEKEGIDTAAVPLPDVATND